MRNKDMKGGDMSRGDFIMIRLTQDEREAIERMAEDELLPLSTFIRRNMLLEARRRGYYPNATQQEARP